MTRRARGFTLVEVLVALVIMATMAAMAWRGIDALTRGREIAQQHLAQTARLQTVLAQWEADLRALQDSRSPVPPLAFDGGNLVLTRQAPAGLQVVVWSLRTGSLWRWESPPLRTIQELVDQRQRGLQQLAERNPALRAFDGVAGWQFYCFWGNAWSNCQSTGGTGQAQQAPAGPVNPKTANQPPSGLRIAVQFGEESGLAGTLTREMEVTVR
ncbi:PulJ/GspJ family protein [Roseateles cellulosilyticus]|uniref:Prepilin-type N-terminal cleavage/methylation domain-containing protein n=1 Tax=Pelomonas cellulosilytica TaxID=2906762 RepID=A0ABS8XWX2_9BURK|nr:prepilin-type N-terminal cleavage/methylation domain-containing protein [Pelomonas sp. P8]MCE4556205.1 prepilin-type N-terminal cleavage/methylation domain-containing protein [Pelomonas sp. P8]